MCGHRIGLLRWSIDLGGYDYALTYRPGHNISHADALNRLPLPNQPESVQGVGNILLLQSDCSLELSPRTIAKLTHNDPLMAKVMHWVMHGWPARVDESLQTFLIARVN